MNKQPKISDRDGGQSLDHALHSILQDVAPVQQAALQVLIYHMEAAQGGATSVTPAEVVAAAGKLARAQAAAVNLVEKRLVPLKIELPADLAAVLGEFTKALQELVQVTDRCEVNSAGELKGFHPAANMYDLCARRAAGSAAQFASGLGTCFLELTERGKADALSKTSTIAMEIGKIGRVINMVATNASIEAARAGDAGRGFTVIADEVKVLSSRVSSLSVSLTDRVNLN